MEDSSPGPTSFERVLNPKLRHFYKVLIQKSHMDLLNTFHFSHSKRIAEELDSRKRTINEDGYRELKIKAKEKSSFFFSKPLSLFLLMDKCVCVSNLNAFEMKPINKPPFS